uniref:NAC domain-containing protein n=1 Tax=Hordeum vulgare subsp. vulgare TaxID=112509 RepID=A0A8I7BCD7_HORVV
MAEEGGGEEELAVVGAGDMEGQIVVAGAAYEEDGGRGGGGGGAGGDEGIFRGDDQFIPPPGFRFKPSDEELIRYYLLPKLQGREYVPNRAIIEHNVYQCHPDQLTGQYMDRGEGKSFYFLSPRVRRYDNGDRPRRDTDDGRGRWKVSTGKTEKEEKKLAGDGTTYCFSVLNYFESPRGGGRKSEWLMRELTVPGYEIKLPKDGGPGGKTLDRYVMCKIYIKDDKGDDDEEAGPSSASPLRLHGPVEGDKWATAEIPKLSKKQAGKRPAVDEQQRNAAAAKKRAHHSKCLQIEAPAPPPQGNGMQAPFSTPGPGWCGGSGQPMGYHAGTPAPRPLLAYNNDQAHVPRQRVAYNGQVPVMARQPAAYNGQVPVMTRQPAAYDGQVPVMTRQPAAYDGQVPVMTRQPAAYNGRVRPPPYRLAGSPNSYGQNLTMMMRPSCPTGQAVNPQMKRQPETDEMLEQRVLQQNLEEHLRMQNEIYPAQQQQRQMAFTQEQQQQQQQRQMAFTQEQQQQQQQLVMPFTQQQQQQAMAFMMRQQQQWRMSFMMHQQQQYHLHQQQRQPYLDGSNADYHHHAGSVAPNLSLDEAAQRYERRRVVLPATSGGSPGVAATVKAEGSPVSTVDSVEGNEEGCNNNGGCGN